MLVKEMIESLKKMKQDAIVIIKINPVGDFDDVLEIKPMKVHARTEKSAYRVNENGKDAVLIN